MWIILASVALAGEVATPVAAVNPAVPAASKAESEKLVCKKLKLTGSHIHSGRACMTKADWEQRTRDDQKAITDMQNKLFRTP